MTFISPLSALKSIAFGLGLTLSSVHASQDVLKSWEKFQRFTGKNIKNFQSLYLASLVDSKKTIFYPFGGADITYPLLLAPQAKIITIVGLEPPGNPEKHPNQLTSSKSVSEKVDSLWRRSFFITSQMAKQFDQEAGVIAPILLQLEHLGAHDISVTKAEGPAQGIKIAFKHHDMEKTIFYFQLNLTNGNLPNEFLNHLSNNNLIDLTLLKATSYCPHQSNFSELRDFIVKASSAIIQDDSGIPYRFIEKNFDTVKLFGPTSLPYGREFKGYTQPDLVKKYESSKTQQVPFCFGYGCGRTPTALLVAIKEDAPKEEVTDGISQPWQSDTAEVNQSPQ